MIKFLRVFCFLCMIGWMVTIFRFSSQTGVESGEVSGKALDIAIRLFDWVTGQDLSGAMTPRLYDILEFCVRKAAHMTVYACLAVNAMGVLFTIPGRNSIRSLISLGFCLFYAVTDEFHQTLVAGRGPALRDVAIDGVGALCGIAAALILYSLIYTWYWRGRHRREKRAERKSRRLESSEQTT